MSYIFSSECFIYFSQLPELVHGGGHKKPLAGCRGHKFCNWDWIIRFILINGGFFIAFAILLVLAIYEEDLNNLI